MLLHSPVQLTEVLQEAIVRNWTKAIVTDNLQDAMACMLPGGANYENIEKILKSKPSDKLYYLKKTC